MSISTFFRTLRSAYQAEIDDLAFDSEGNNVLRQRLAQRRKEVTFLLQMMELSPEMVAVVFHQAFRFKLPGAMEHLISHESEELPEWSTLADAITQAPWAKDLAELVLKQPLGEWFMSVAAGLEYLYHKVDASAADARDNDEEDDADDHTDDHNGEGGGEDKGNNVGRDGMDSDEEKDARARDEAGADWMEAQGFDRKE
jgi:hypothetical protein